MRCNNFSERTEIYKYNNIIIYIMHLSFTLSLKFKARYRKTYLFRM